MNKSLNILFGQQANKIKQINVLIVGVGGIGCQLIKNLSKCGFKKFTLIDLDTIEITNLNRQFYFKNKHRGMSKAQVAKQSLLKLNPQLQISAICDSIYNYSKNFFQKFNIVFSALDNYKARQYLSEMCMKYNIYLIDSGTQGFVGQAKSIIKNMYACHLCIPPLKTSQQSLQICTIRDKPSKPIHCMTWGKNLFQCIFGSIDNQNVFKGHINMDVLKQKDCNNLQSIRQQGLKLFNKLFYQDIKQKDAQNQKISQIKNHYPLSFQYAITLQEIAQSRRQGQKNPPNPSNDFYDQIWSIKQYANRFIQSFVKIVIKNKDKIGFLQFEKDDQNIMEFVYCASMLRTFNYLKQYKGECQLKYLSFYELKDKLGKVIPAIASTNAIAAASQTIQALKIIFRQFDKLIQISFLGHPYNKISKYYLTPSQINCPACSQRIIVLIGECNFEKTTFNDLVKKLKKYFLNDFSIFSGAYMIFNTTSKSKSNLQNCISQLKQNIKNNNEREFVINAKNYYDMNLYINLENNQNKENLKFNMSPKEVRKYLLSYMKKRTIEQKQQLKYYLKQMVDY